MSNLKDRSEQVEACQKRHSTVCDVPLHQDVTDWIHPETRVSKYLGQQEPPSIAGIYGIVCENSPFLDIEVCKRFNNLSVMTANKVQMGFPVASN